MTLTLAAETKTVRISVYATEDTQGMEKLARVRLRDGLRLCIDVKNICNPEFKLTSSKVG